MELSRHAILIEMTGFAAYIHLLIILMFHSYLSIYIYLSSESETGTSLLYVCRYAWRALRATMEFGVDGRWDLFEGNLFPSGEVK